ncbi:MAG: CoA transferase [Rubrobacter sp.]|nr:CoA transferase [Rubrobacter sp.]
MTAGAPLSGLRAVTLAVNVPGPAAAARLREFGAGVVKAEPPGGDPLARYNPAWYRALSDGQEVLSLDLKEAAERERLHGLLANADLFLTSSRPAALQRLGLIPAGLHEEYPRLGWVAIVGHPSPRADEPGHDLTYLAGRGLLDPPDLPRTLLADLAGAERAVSAALGLLLARERGAYTTAYAEVALSEAAAAFDQPLRHGITGPGGLLGGGLPGYNLYRCSEGWIAIAALEEHFLEALRSGLGLPEAGYEDLQKAFQRRTAAYWEGWAAERDLPLVAVRETPP